MGRILLGILAILATVAPPLVTTLDFIRGLGRGSVVFLAPGQAEIAVAEAGRWYLYHDHRTTFDGRSFSQSPGLPHGATFRLMDSSGGIVPVAPDPAQIAVHAGGTDSVSVVCWDLESGTYTVTVDGFADEVVCSMGEMRVLGFLVDLLKAVGLSLILLVVGIVSILSGARARRRDRGQESPAAEEERNVLPDR